MRAEFQLRLASENGRAFVRPILKCELLERRRSRRGADLAGELPGVAHDPHAARQRDSDRARQRKRAVELRHAAIEAERAVELGGQRLICRIDAEPELELAILADAVSRYPKAIRLAAGDKGAFAVERSEERADIAVERNFLQHQP